MALEKVRDILQLGVRDNTAVYAFDATDLDQIYAVLHGAERANKPIIAMLYPAPPLLKTYTLEYFAAVVKSYAKDIKVPVGLHLDHCSDYYTILAAMKAGFTSVMADGSMLPFDENVAFTDNVVKSAKIFDVDVEGELGHVGRGTNLEDYGDEDMYTTAEDAKKFTELVDVASLAVAFGSAHGVYKKTPKLSITRLAEINAVVDTPLVLHGGSGIPEDQLVEAFKNGINKFNVGTEFGMLTRKLNAERYEKAEAGKEAIYVREGLTDYIEKKISLCNVKL